VSHLSNEAGSDPARDELRDLGPGAAPVDLASTSDEIGCASEPRRDDELGFSLQTEIATGQFGVDADVERNSGPGPVWPSSLLVEDARRLQAALAELEECERILGAARRA